LATAGEMNGFLKQGVGLLTAPLRVERGRIWLDQAFRPRLDPAAVAAARVGRDESYVAAGVGATAP
jgi:hypothetical protein